MSDATYNLKQLPILLKKGLRRNISSDRFKRSVLEYSINEHLPSLDLKYAKLPIYKKMDPAKLFDRKIYIHDDPADTVNVAPPVDIVIDEGHVTEMKMPWREKQKVSVYDIYCSRNNFDKYQNYFLPKQRLSDLCYLNTVNPILIKFSSNRDAIRTIQYIGTGRDNLNCNTIVVDVGTNANVEITENFDSSNIYLTNIHYIVRKGAKLKVLRDIHAGNSSTIIDSTVTQYPNSNFNMTVYGGVNKYAQNLFDIYSYKNCYTSVQGSFDLTNDNSSNFYINMNHLAKNSTSDIDIKNVVDNTSFTSFYGKIFISKDATDVDAQMYNKNLQLSTNATVITEPTLDINNKEVQCKHGCTVSNLCEDDLYYLHSRGINTEDAKDILVSSFLKNERTF